MVRRTFPLSIILAVHILSCSEPSTSGIEQGEQPNGVEAKKDTVRDAVAAGDTLSNGPHVITTEDGGRIEGVMQGGQRVGTWTSYFPNGNVRSQRSYVNGLADGPTVVNHPNGMPYYVGRLRKGKSFGEWVFYDEQGKELKRVTFDETGTITK
jgi:antitoxin component YwqK of YwqJK toxin-antitoxin module